MHELDECDQEILEAVEDRPFWKNKIWERISVDRSVQAVSRRVENLVEDGYLENTFIEPSDLNDRDLIVAFKLTEDGRDVIENGLNSTNNGD